MMQRKRVREDITSRMLDDMEVQHFYNNVEQKVNKPSWAHGINEVLHDLQELRSLHERGYLDEFPPMPYQSVDGTTVMTSEQRKDHMYQILAGMVPNHEDRTLYEIEQDLRMGKTEIYEKECELDMSTDETLNNMEWQNEEPDYIKYAKRRIEKGIPFNSTDVQYLNEEIQREFESIENMYAASQGSAYAVSSLADISDRRRAEGHIPDSAELPAYLDNEISAESPDDMRSRSDEMYKRAEEQREDSLEELYKNVWDLEKYNAGQSSSHSSILTRETKRLLGEGYEAYDKKRFEEELNGFRERHVATDAPKKQGLYGIDLTQGATGSRPKEKVKEDVAQEQNTAMKDVITEKTKSTKKPVLKTESSVVIEDTDDMEQTTSFGED